MVEQYASHPEISTDQLIERLERPGPQVIALEGGPCGGKTTIASVLASEAANQGRAVVILPEVATELGTKLLENGLSIPHLAEHDRPGYIAFQKDLISKIAANITEAKEHYAGTNALIIADRSDNAAYMTPQEYQEVLTDTGLLAPPHATLIDTIIYLPSLAHSNAEQYESLMQTNAARFESPNDAVATCLRNLNTISMHPNVHVYWGTDFKDKTERVLRDVLQSPHKQPETQVLAGGAAIEQLHAVLAKLDTVPLETYSVTRSSHEGFELEHRITQSGNDLYYYSSTKQEVLPRSTLNEHEFNILRQMRCYNETFYECQQHVIESDGRKVLASTKLYKTGHWTLEVQ